MHTHGMAWLLKTEEDAARIACLKNSSPHRIQRLKSNPGEVGLKFVLALGHDLLAACQSKYPNSK